MQLPLSVLCLHGNSMTAGAMQSHMRRLASHLKGVVRFKYLQGPHVVPRRADLPDGFAAGADVRGWWNVRKDAAGGWCYDGVDESLQAIADAQAEAAAEDGIGFRGILGFSQGGSLATLVAGLHASGRTPPLLPALDHVVLAGGFPYGAVEPDFSALFASPIDMASLHAVGERDEMVKPATSERAVALFKGAAVHRHAGGHVVPSGKASLLAFDLFFRSRVADGDAAGSRLSALLSKM